MQNLREFTIGIFNLRNGRYQYDFQLDNEFFSFFENALLEEGNLKVRAELDKSERLITLDVSIQGSIKLICDRSLRPFDFSVDTERKLYFKYAEENEEISEELIHIRPDTQSLELGQIFYEFTALEIPMKRIHPDLQSDEPEDDEAFLVYTSSEVNDDFEENENDNAEEGNDPRWEELRKLRNKNQN